LNSACATGIKTDASAIRCDNEFDNDKNGSFNSACATEIKTDIIDMDLHGKDKYVERQEGCLGLLSDLKKANCCLNKMEELDMDSELEQEFDTEIEMMLYKVLKKVQRTNKWRNEKKAVEKMGKQTKITDYFKSSCGTDMNSKTENICVNGEMTAKQNGKFVNNTNMWCEWSLDLKTEGDLFEKEQKNKYEHDQKEQIEPKINESFDSEDDLDFGENQHRLREQYKQIHQVLLKKCEQERNTQRMNRKIEKYGDEMLQSMFDLIKGDEVDRRLQGIRLDILIMQAQKLKNVMDMRIDDQKRRYEAKGKDLPDLFDDNVEIDEEIRQELDNDDMEISGGSKSGDYENCMEKNGGSKSGDLENCMEKNGGSKSGDLENCMEISDGERGKVSMGKYKYNNIYIEAEM